MLNFRNSTFPDLSWGQGGTSLLTGMHYKARTVMLPLKIESKSILIVDDEYTHLYLIGKMMNLLGYDVHTCINPVSALEFIQQSSDVRLLLIDIAMGEMRGESLVRQAREEIPGIKVIFMTGLGEDFHEVNDEEDMILYKPFSLQELSYAVSSKLL